MSKTQVENTNKKSKNPLVLTDENYYSQQANEKYFSVSQFKDFLKCEAMALAKIKGEYKQEMTKPLLVGSFVDAYFEGTFESFKKEHPEIFKQDNELKADFKKANQIINRIVKDELFSKFMSGDKQKIITFEMFGVWWKCKLDSYIKDVCINDLKVVQNLKTLPLWRYDIQGAVYQKGIEIVEGKKLPFYLSVATKERVIDIDIFQIPDNVLDEALSEVEMLISLYSSIKEGKQEPTSCGICDYCKLRKKATVRNYLELM